MGFSLMSFVGFENSVLYLILDFHPPQSPSHAMPIGSKSGNLAFVTTWLKGLRHTDSPNSFSEGAEIVSATCAIHFSAGIRKRFKMIRALYEYQNKWHYYFACLTCVIWNVAKTVRIVVNGYVVRWAPQRKLGPGPGPEPIGVITWDTCIYFRPFIRVIT